LVTVSAAQLAYPGNTQLRVTVNGQTSAPLWFAITAPQQISSLQPASVRAGATGFSLTVNGSGFTSDTQVTWNGSALPTTYMDATRLTATVVASLIAAPATVRIAVVQDGRETDGPALVVVAPPVITTLTPASAPAGSAPLTLTIDGAGFQPNSIAYWNSLPLATTVVSATRLTAQVPPTPLATPGKVSITVLSAGETSADAAFTVTYTPTPVLAFDSATASPLTPSALTIDLDSPAPVALKGTLALSFAPDAPGLPDAYLDPAARFLAGGTSLAIAIAKSQTRAVIPGAGLLQPGTVAGQLRVTLSGLGLPDGVTPTFAPLVAQLTIPGAAPEIAAGSLRYTVSGATLIVEVDAYSTPRDLASADLTFTLADGSTHTTIVDLADILAAWFASPEGLAAGSRFHLRLPLTPGFDLSQLSVISVTITNSVGVSPAVSTTQSFGIAAQTRSDSDVSPAVFAKLHDHFQLKSDIIHSAALSIPGAEYRFFRDRRCSIPFRD
jgi:hypothetical protein